MLSPSGPLVSVIVLNHDGIQHIQDCVRTLKSQDYSRLELIVADNASRDGSDMLAHEMGAKVVRMGANLGFSKANNRAAAVARGELLFFVNNDMKFEPDCVSGLVKAFDESPSLFAADPVQLNWEGSKLIHGVTKLRRGAIGNWLPFFKVDFCGKPTPMDVPWGCAGSLMVERRKFDELGGFDPTFFIDIEDLDLCLRAWMRGWRTTFVPGSVLFHKGGATMNEGGGGQPLRWLSAESNLMRFAMKSMSMKGVLRLFFAKVLSAVGLLAKGDSPRAWAIMRAAATNIRGIGGTLQERARVQGISDRTADAVIDSFSSVGKP